MVRGGGGGGGAKKGETAEAEERKRLKSLALRNNLLSETPARLSVGGCSHALSPSKTLIKHHGKEIIRKSQRSGKNRYLFSFPGLLAPISGGKIGELKDLGTKNPVLYLDFPQGQMKLFGTIVYPKNRYLTLQFSRSGKNVVCEDYFDNMIVFSDAWWIGRKGENPEEARLEFPKEMNVQAVEFDFKGGAGGTSIRKTSDLKTAKDYVPQQSPVHELQYDSSDSQKKSNELVEVTPSRKSARTAGKTKRYVEALSSGDDLVDNGVEITGSDFVDKGEETSVGVEEEVALIDIHKKGGHDKTEKSCRKVLELDKEEAETETPIQKKRKQSTKSVSKSKELARSNQITMVQATLSSLFKKTEEKMSGSKLKARAAGKQKNGSESAPGRKQSKIEVEDDDIEEFTSRSQDKNTSDEDWTA